MNSPRNRKGLSFLMSVALIASLFVATTGATLAAVTGISYVLNGQAAGTTVPASVPVATFNPAIALTTANVITLTFPSGTTLGGGNAASYTCQQGAGSTNILAVGSLTVSGSGGGAPQISFRCQAASLGAAGSLLTFATSPSGAGLITNPTVAGTYSFSVGIDNGDSGSISSSVVPGPVSGSQSSFTAVPTTVAADNVSTTALSLTLKDSFGNVVTAAKNVSVVQSGGTTSASPTPTTGTTAGGSFSTTAKTGTAGTATYQAADTSDGITLTTTPTVTYISNPSNVTCAPNGGANPGGAVSISAGTSVHCTLNPGTGYGNNVSWSASGFTPSTSSNLSQFFTAGTTAGSAVIGATWTDSGTGRSRTVYYTITTASSSVSCGPSGGTTSGTATPIAPSSNVTCSFTAGTGYNNDFAWHAAGFTPASSGASPTTFLAGTTGGLATITGTWTDASGAHSVTAYYTITTNGSSVVCTPSSGTIAANASVPCTFGQGSAYTPGTLHWDAIKFTPNSLNGTSNVTFTAAATAGSASITASWQDNGVPASQVFNFTISTTASSVICSPPSGSSIAASSVVNCSFSFGSGYTAGSLGWTAGNFSPAALGGSTTPTFTAGTIAGPANITANWQDNGIAQSQSFTYTITTNGSTVTCSPSSGTLAAGAQATCTFTIGSAYTASSLSWTSSGFAPASVGNATNPTFTAQGTAGPANITANWQDGGVAKSQTFTYTISTTASSVNCNPGGGTIADGQVVNCSFSPGTGFAGGSLSWTSSQFSPPSSTQAFPAFTAGTTSGPASITATWTDGTGNHSQPFSYTISTTASTVVCNPPNGSALGAGDSVNCTFLAGAGYGGNLAWTATNFSPTTSGIANPTFTAANVNGTGTINATWTDGAGAHSALFSYPITTTASTIHCTPPNGTLAPAQVVNCSFNAGSGYVGGSFAWTASNLTPPNSTNGNQAFAAGSTAGPASINATWSDASGNHSRTFSYTINTTGSAVTCNPASGTIAVGSVVNCSLTPGSGYQNNVAWTSAGFTPAGPVNTISAAFTAQGTAGGATITVTWSDGAGDHTQGFAYTISASSSSVTCSPPSGTIAAGQVVPCAFTPGNATVGPSWIVPGFIAGPGGNNPAFTAGATGGTATITANWTDGGVNHSQTFTYAISTTASAANCNPAGGPIAVSSVVNCSFVPGTGYAGNINWTTVDFNPAASNAANPSFTAQGTAGAASITATWTDGAGDHSQTFGYTVSASASSVTCSPPSGTIAAGQMVPCAFTAGNAAVGPSWVVAGFASGPGGSNPIFTAGTTAGAATITANWTDGGVNHSQTFTYTISTTATSVGCTPSGGPISAGQVVNCTFNPGTGFVAGSRNWSTSEFSPATDTVANPVFTAGSTAGPASITVTWRDSSGIHSQTFSYTVGTSSSVVDCNPSSGTIAVGSAVNCSFVPGTGYGGNISWSAVGFTPSGPIGTTSPSFSAGGTAGAATITATWSDGTGSHAQAFSYTISASLSSVTCSPDSGTIAAGQTVPCAFTAGNAASGPSWIVSGFQAGPGGSNPAFLALNTPGPATITANWTDGGVNHSQTFSYTISATASSANCTPPNGALTSGAVVNCAFTAGSGYQNNVTWTSIGFSPGGPVGTSSQAFTAGGTAGPATITGTWSDATGDHSVAFSYTIATTASAADCNPPSGTIASGAVVNCTFNGGTGSGTPAWTASGFTANGGGTTAPSFIAGTTAGPATITVTWTDASGSHSQGFAYTISTTASSASCSPPTGSTIAAGTSVNCSFTAGTGLIGSPVWSASGFSANGGGTSSPSFLAGTTAGPAVITVTWSDSSGSHSQGFNYTISTSASAVSCNPPSGTLVDGQVVNCAFNPGQGYTGNLHWNTSDFTPGNSNNTSPTFTAFTVAGPASITATWTDGTGFHSQTFNYTVSTTASTVVCNPSSLSIIASGANVQCQFNPGAGYLGDLLWTTSNFSPSSSVASPVSFMAGTTAGTATIQATWTDGAGFQSQTFTYTISTTASSASCNPAGGPIASGQVVNCVFNPGSGYNNNLTWTNAGFGGGSTNNPVPAFTAGTIAGPASITATWSDGTGIHSQTFNYTISNSLSAATCSPSGGTVPASSVINCSFSASLGYVNGSLHWHLSSGFDFQPGSGGSSISPAIGTGSTAGPQTITADWTDGSGNQSQAFSYNVGTTASEVDCSPPDGAIAPGSVVNCTFTPGTGYVAASIHWTSSSFTPASTAVTNAAFTASTTFGPATITALWTDGSGGHNQSFAYTISSTASSVNCSPINGSQIIPGSLANCLFTPGAAYVVGSLSWTASNFTPPTSTTAGQAFTAGSTAGAASITATWNDGAGIRTQTFAYTVVVSSLVCNPGGGPINTGATVICLFTPAPGAAFAGWTAAGFAPNIVNSPSAIFTAGSPSLVATITASWTDASGPHTTVFTYSILALPALTKTSITATTALGKTKDPGDFTVGTKVASIAPGTNNVVTIRFAMSPSMAGKTIQIYEARRSCVSGTGPGLVTCAPGRHYNGWSSFTLLTARAVDADGFAYLYVSTHVAQWLSFYGSYLGDSGQAPGRSQTQQIRWK